MHNHWEARVTIIFATREHADRWWRAIADLQTSNGSGGTYGHIKRISPQFYTYDYTKGTISDTIIKAKNTDKALLALSDFIIISANTNLYGFGGSQGPFDILPSQPIVDRVSGGIFSIQSKLDRTAFWYEADDGHVHMSNTERAKFCIWIADGNSKEENHGRIMVPSDEIYVTLLKANSGTTRYLVITDDAQVVLSARRSKLSFRDFFGGYYTANVLENSGGGKPSKPEGASIYFAESGGDQWELIN